uniref:Uncharacterized protein n=1 Tax=viral metagenome TaxID=1070528 RepID=A0A6C0IS16_9ZZZZ
MENTHIYIYIVYIYMKNAKSGKTRVNKTTKRGKKGVNKTRKYKKGSRKNAKSRTKRGGSNVKVSAKDNVIHDYGIKRIMNFNDFKEKFAGREKEIRESLEEYTYNPNYISCNLEVNSNSNGEFEPKVLRNAYDQAFDLVTCWSMSGGNVDNLLTVLAIEDGVVTF